MYIYIYMLLYIEVTYRYYVYTCSIQINIISWCSMNIATPYRLSVDATCVILHATTMIECFNSLFSRSMQIQYYVMKAFARFNFMTWIGRTCRILQISAGFLTKWFMVFGHLLSLESQGQGRVLVFRCGQANPSHFCRGKVSANNRKTIGTWYKIVFPTWAKVMGGLMAVIPASEVDTHGWARSFHAAPVQL